MTASDPDGASAAHAIAVTVGDGDSSNQPPVASSDIPDHSVRMGSSVTVDGSNYFSDPDGDDLTYTASSSNDEVATVAVEGSTATITAVAVGSAVVTMTASDGEADASQGFGVTVTEESTIKEATVTIFGLREVTDRNASVDPTDVSGDVSVLLDVQPNDENVTAIDLTLGEMVISCRGTSNDGATPVGLANSGGAVEVECFFDTDAVMGYCEGMQLDPQFANGEHELGARITVATGDTRDALATQMVTLNNSNYVMIDHNPGGTSLVVGGVTYYGGPSSEENLNTFDVCPVAFDGTMVGSIGLRAATATQADESRYGNNLSFLTHRSGRYGEFYGVRRTDREAPFTYTVLSSQNAHIEDRTADGHGGHMIIQDGTISDPDGLDITDKFVPGDMDNDLTEIGPVYFDFASPRLAETSEVQIGGAAVVEGTSYSDVKSGRAQSLSVSGVTERGSGGESSTGRGRHNAVIAVGDCSVGANTDGGRAGAGTAFVAVVDDANVVGDIPEDDAVAGELSDDGGVDCYTAELQSLTDPLGNSRGMSTYRIQSAAHFGVDRGRPVIDDQEPDEVLVLRDGSMLTFEVEDPDLETGEAGTGVNAGGILAWAGSSRSRRYWTGDSFVSESEGLVTIPTHVGRTSVVGNEAGEDGRHTVAVAVPDGASPPNYASTSFTFVRDTKDPTFVVSKSQSNIGLTNSPSVLANVGGVISDGSVIQKAELSLRMIAAGEECADGTALSEGRTGRVPRNTRDLENDTNKIEFDETFTIRRVGQTGQGPETYCFWLDVEDSATGSDGRGDGNSTQYTVGQFSVQWPGEPPTTTPVTPDPTFEFTTLGENTATPPVDPAPIDMALEVTEGDATGTMYAVKLANVATAPTATAPLAVTLAPSAGVSVNPTTLSFDGTKDTLVVTVTTAHDLDITSDEGMVTHSATDYAAASLAVKSMDEDFEIMVSPSSISEDAGPTEVTVTVNAGEAADVTNAVQVNLAPATGANADDIATGSAATASVTVSAMTRTGEAKVMVDAADDAARDEVGESIALTATSTEQGVYVKSASIMIGDDDPDVALSLDMDEVDEDAGTVTVEITATADAPVNGITTFELALSGTAGADDYTANPTSVTLTINARATTGSAMVTLTITDDATDESNETIIFDDADGATVGTKTYTVDPVTLTIVDNDDT